jgi:hypothetical protein
MAVLVTKEVTYDMACKLTAELLGMMRERAIRVVDATDGHAVRFTGHLPLTIGWSDWMDDRRITIYGPANSELLVGRDFCMHGPFTLDIFLPPMLATGGKSQFECYFRSPLMSGSQHFMSHNIYSLFRSRVLTIRQKKGKC